MSKPLLDSWTPLGLAWRSMLVATPLLWAVAWPRIDGLSGFDLTAGQWAAVTYSGLLSTGIAYALWNIGIRQVGAARTAVFVNLLPVVALTTGALALGEAITLVQAAGGAVVIAGIAVMRRAR